MHLLPGRENVGHRDREAIQQDGRRGFSFAAVLAVLLAVENEDGDLSLLGIDDPILLDASIEPTSDWDS